MKFRSLLVAAALACSPAVLSASASAAGKKVCDVSIEGTDAMQYSTKELSIGKDCTDVKVTLKHAGKLPKSAMGHNWVLTAAKDKDAVLKSATESGLAKEYAPNAPDKVIAATKLVGGGETATTEFSVSKLKAGESYVYFCTFPGHAALMNGTFTVK